MIEQRQIKSAIFALRWSIFTGLVTYGITDQLFKISNQWYCITIDVYMWLSLGNWNMCRLLLKTSMAHWVDD